MEETVGGEGRLGDFTQQAEAYARSRPGYPEALLQSILARTRTVPGDPVVDLGAGTGLLTRWLVGCGLVVTAVEPNQAMRQHGQQVGARWVSGTFEATTLAAQSQHWAIAAQSFHWAQPGLALPEIHRILRPGGWITLLWNDKDPGRSPLLEWTYQRIRHWVPGFSEGYHHTDWAQVLTSTGHFQSVKEESTVHWVPMSAERYLELWQSHNRLAHLAGPAGLDPLWAELRQRLKEWPQAEIPIPYRCVSWTAQRVENEKVRPRGDFP